ncbi:MULTISPECIES: glycosyltransferase family 4 protein [unclassified Blastococcus]
MLHLVTSTQRRGAEAFAVTLHERLVARGHRGHVAALVRGDHPPELDVPALGRRPLGVAPLARVRRAARGVDVVVAHGSRTLPASVLALAGTRVPVVYVNIGDPLFWANTPSRRARVRLMLARVRAVAALSEASRTVLVERFGLAPEAVRVIPNGRRAADFPPADDARRRAARAELGLHPDRDVVLFLGALSPEKRPDVAIDAVARLDGGTGLLVCGDGPLREEAERQAATALGDRAAFLGTRSDVSRVLAAADVLVVPSDSEGLPGVLIEAGMAGLPVVASDVGFVREVVLDGVSGFLVPPGDPAATAAAVECARARREALGAAGRRYCLDRFEMEKVVDAWESLLSDVCR